MTPTRSFFLVVAVPIIALFFMREKPGAVDWLVIVYVIWVVLAFFVKRGAAGIEAAGQSFLEISVPYLMARLFLKAPAQVVRLLTVMSIIIGILGLLAIPEAVLHKRFLHDVPRLLTGIFYEMQSDTRLSMLRAASTFENPILFGLFCATFLSLVWYSAIGLRTRLALAGGIGLATFMSLSSAPLLLLLLQIVLIAMERATRGYKRRLQYALYLLVFSVVFVETFSDRGVARLIASELTFNSETGYYRLLQWEYSIDDVLANPLFGINFENWTKPFWLTDSIDNHWLFLAMNSGGPAVLLMSGLIGFLAFRLYRRRRTLHDPVLRSLMLGWIIGIVALCLGAWTVTLFGKMHPTLFFLIGIGSALLKMVDTATECDAPTNAVEKARLHYSRFPPRRRGEVQ